MSEAFLEQPDHYDLVYVGPRGADTWGFGFQPTTDDLALYKVRPDYKYVVQKVGEQFEVYDLGTLKRIHPHASSYTIGLPVFVCADPDAAIMWALMNL